MPLPDKFKDDLTEKLSLIPNLTDKQKSIIIDSLSQGKDIQWNLFFSQSPKEPTQ